ncbi:hypothetical protein J4G08_20520 [Candidatus Poribacteria bacterium]|nr:hypothetical protein [Candidatus Poribacteria bacterium]
MVLGTIDIQYIDNKFAGKVGVDTFFASWMSVHFVVSIMVDAIFWSLGKEIIGELNASDIKGNFMDKVERVCYNNQQLRLYLKEMER